MSSPVPDPLPLVEAAYHQHYETTAVRASVSFLGVETIEILRYEQTDYGGDRGTTSYLSLGMSRYPMAEPTVTTVDPHTAPRAELMLSTLGQPDEVWRQLAVLAAAPAVESAVYQLGMRVELGETWCAGSRCTGALVVDSPLLPISVPGMAAVTVFRLLPTAPTEMAWARVHGSEALLARWNSAGTDLRDLYRDPVEFG